MDMDSSSSDFYSLQFEFHFLGDLGLGLGINLDSGLSICNNIMSATLMAFVTRK